MLELVVVGKCMKVHGESNVEPDMMVSHGRHGFCVATKREHDLARGINGVILRAQSGPQHDVPCEGDVHEGYGRSRSYDGHHRAVLLMSTLNIEEKETTYRGRTIVYCGTWRGTMTISMLLPRGLLVQEMVYNGSTVSQSDGLVWGKEYLETIPGY